MTDRNEGLRRQLKYIEQALQLNQHDYDGREQLLRDVRKRILEQLEES